MTCKWKKNPSNSQSKSSGFVVIYYIWKIKWFQEGTFPTKVKMMCCKNDNENDNNNYWNSTAESKTLRLQWEWFVRTRRWEQETRIISIIL